jgi:selenide,water dikinase
MENSSKKSSNTLTGKVKDGGCAAKISSAELHEMLAELTFSTSKNLLTKLENFEDAAVYKISEDLAIVQTIDFFPPMVDDPYLYGEIAATNALSDIYAMGGAPLLAMNILSFPTCDFPIDVAREILRGGAVKVREAGCLLVGGHSIQGSEPIYGLSVSGFIHPSNILTNGGAQNGDLIVLCKPIGTGVALLGLKGGMLSQSTQTLLTDSLTTLNSKSLQVGQKFRLNALTDVTGFGLIGHVHEMAKASGLQANLQSSSIPFFPEVKELAEQGFVPAGAYANRNSYEKHIIYIDDVDLKIMDLLFDPQTAGGLLMSVDAADADKLCTSLGNENIQANVIGSFKSPVPSASEEAATVGSVSITH